MSKRCSLEGKGGTKIGREKKEGRKEVRKKKGRGKEIGQKKGNSMRCSFETIILQY